jgi:pimeloyl-ACP methyl ester carboxylesterase
MDIAHQVVNVCGMPLHYQVAGDGPAMVLLHGDGGSSADWQWVLPALASHYRVYAPDLPGSGASAKPAADYSPAFYARVVAGLFDSLGLDQAVVVGHSLGGLIALRLALAVPARVAALVLVSSGGLGRAINSGMIVLTLPGSGDLAVLWGQTPLGAAQRLAMRAAALFARPWRAPPGWLREQFRLAQQPGFLAATLASLRAGIDIGGQREVLLDQLPRLAMPTLVV